MSDFVHQEINRNGVVIKVISEDRWPHNSPRVVVETMNRDKTTIFAEDMWHARSLCEALVDITRVIANAYDAKCRYKGVDDESNRYS